MTIRVLIDRVTKKKFSMNIDDHGLVCDTKSQYDEGDPTMNL